MQLGRDAERRHERGGARRDEAADAPQPVQRRQDRAPVAMLDGGAVGVHGDVGHAARSAHDEQHARQHGRTRSNQYERQCEVRRCRRPGQDGPRPVALDEEPGCGHGRHRTDRHGEQHDAERTRAQPEIGLDVRDVRRPRRDQRAVDEEDGRHREAPPAQLARRGHRSLTVHGAHVASVPTLRGGRRGATVAKWHSPRVPLAASAALHVRPRSDVLPPARRLARLPRGACRGATHLGSA